MPFIQREAEAFAITNHKLVIDVATRWNSAVDMISRYLEQQPVIYAALTFKKLRKEKKIFLCCLKENLHLLKNLLLF